MKKIKARSPPLQSKFKNLVWKQGHGGQANNIQNEKLYQAEPDKATTGNGIMKLLSRYKGTNLGGI